METSLVSSLAEGPQSISTGSSRRRTWSDWLPGLQTLRQYRAAWLRNDIVAGIVLSTMLVPVGIAYAVASGVPAIYGLYATIVPLIAGPSSFMTSRWPMLSGVEALSPSLSVAVAVSTTRLAAESVFDSSGFDVG